LPVEKLVDDAEALIALKREPTYGTKIVTNRKSVY
jgi:hypothetical protein